MTSRVDDGVALCTTSPGCLEPRRHVKGTLQTVGEHGPLGASSLARCKGRKGEGRQERRAGFHRVLTVRVAERPQRGIWIPRSRPLLKHPKDRRTAMGW